ncbi:MAG: hypothetical protein WBQ94_23905, partial [Terracidiphilus sp.]
MKRVAPGWVWPEWRTVLDNSRLHEGDTGLVGDNLNLKNERNSSRRRGLEAGRWLIFLMLFSGRMQVRAQQGPIPAAATTLPDVPEPQGSTD